LQLWDKDEQFLIYEEFLVAPLTLYGGNSKYFWYQPMKPENEERFNLSIINLCDTSAISIVRIKNIFED